MNTRATGRAMMLAATAISGILLLAGCSGEASPGESTGPTVDSELSSFDGVPTLEELYEGIEEPPPAEGPTAAEGKSVIWVSCAEASAGCSFASRTGAEAAEAIGWDFKIIDGKGNAENGWADGIRAAITESPDGIIAYGIPCETVKQPLQEAKDAGIPVIGMIATDCPDTPMFARPTLYNSVSPSVEEYDFVLGEMAAAYAINKLDGDGKVLFLYSPEVQLATADGFRSMIANCEGCEVVEEIPVTTADWANKNTAMVDKVTTSLQRHPDVDVIVGPSFDTWLTVGGLQKALVDYENATGTDLTVVMGKGDAEAMDYLREGRVPDAIIGQPQDMLGWAVIDVLNREFNGADNVPEGYGARLIDMDNNAGTTGAYQTPIDFKAAYKKVWGVD